MTILHLKRQLSDTLEQNYFRYDPIELKLYWNSIGRDREVMSRDCPYIDDDHVWGLLTVFNIIESVDITQRWVRS